jgi:hypothetical protein
LLCPIAFDTVIRIQGAIKIILFHHRPLFPDNPAGERTPISPEFSRGVDRFSPLDRDMASVAAQRRRLGAGRQARYR